MNLNSMCKYKQDYDNMNISEEDMFTLICENLVTGFFLNMICIHLYLKNI